MKGLLSNTIVFTIGAGLGALVAWKLLENKYKQIINEEIESVKEVYSRKFEPEVQEPEKVEPEETTELINCERVEYSNLVNKLGYSNKEVDTNMHDDPRVISPEEFGELDDYETVSLTYYADGVLTDDQDEIIENVGDFVVPDFASHFGEYEDDSVFVRNDKTKTDYEILRDMRAYNYPHPLEDE